VDEDDPDLTPGGDSEPRPAQPGHHRRCPECRGRKRLPGMIKTTEMGSGMGSSFGPCPTCDGLGYVTDAIEE
jgi:DnaJ-class molecular chaperone